MKPRENRELAAIVAQIEEDERRKARRFAVLTWTLTVSYAENEVCARRQLAKVSPLRRGGIVDRETGSTWASRKTYQYVMWALCKLPGIAPVRFKRVGNICALRLKKRSRSEGGRWSQGHPR